MPLLWYAIVTISPAGHAGSGLLAGVTVVVAALLALSLAGHLARRAAAGTPAFALAATAVRARTRLVRPVRQIDPDAAGRPRPRAPSRNR